MNNRPQIMDEYPEPGISTAMRRFQRLMSSPIYEGWLCYEKYSDRYDTYVGPAVTSYLVDFEKDGLKVDIESARAIAEYTDVVAHLEKRQKEYWGRNDKLPVKSE